MAEEVLFKELPQALVEELLGQIDGLSDSIGTALGRLLEERESLRQTLFGEIRLDRDLPQVEIPTTCGVDGSYVVERLLSVDIAAYGAVALEGLAPPSERRFWPDPHHLTNAFVIAHSERNTVGIRGIMIAQELRLATEAPHDIVMIDGSLTTPIIYLNQAMTALRRIPSEDIQNEIIRIMRETPERYSDVLGSPRTDKTYVGLPKYSTRREFASRLDELSKFEDRGILSFILEPGEYVGPYALDSEREEGWHLDLRSHPDQAELEPAISEVVRHLSNTRVIYYKPRGWLPAIRLEVGDRVVTNRQRLSQLLEGIRWQCPKASIFEPYPIYMADRMVRHLARAVPAMRQAMTQSMAMRDIADTGDVYMAMQNYRTESGR